MTAAELDQVTHQDGIQGVARVEIATEGPRGYIERIARIDGVDDEFFYGVSPNWQEHYGVGPDDYPPHATTNDVFVASMATCLMAVYAAALEARRVPIVKGQLTASAHYDIGPGPDSPEWYIRSVRIVYSLRLSDEKDRATAQRVLGFYETGCPLSQTLKGSRCTVTSELEFV